MNGNSFNWILKVRKIIILVACLFIAITMCSCQDESVDEVNALIDAIGNVDLKSGDAIESARTGYNALSDRQKKEVENYDALTIAEENFSVLQEKLAEVEDCYNKAEAAMERLNITELKTVCENGINVGKEIGETEMTSSMEGLIENAASICYGNSDIVKFEAVVTATPKDLKNTNIGSSVQYIYTFENSSDINSSMNEYIDYLSEHFTPNGEDTLSYSFKTDDGCEIKVIGVMVGSLIDVLTIDIDAKILL